MQHHWTGSGGRSTESVPVGAGPDWAWLPQFEVLLSSDARVPLSDDRASAFAAAIVDSTKNRGLRHFVACRFFELPFVRAVAFQVGTDALHVWTIVDALDDEELDQVYDIEIEMMDRFGEQRFDFYVVASEGRPLERFVRTEQACVITRENDLA